MIKFENKKEQKVEFEKDTISASLRELYSLSLNEVVEDIKRAYILNKRIPEELINMNALDIISVYVKDIFKDGVLVNEKGNLQVSTVAQSLSYEETETENQCLSLDSFIQIFCNGGIINTTITKLIHRNIVALEFDLYSDYEDLIFAYDEEDDRIKLYSQYEIKLYKLGMQIQKQEDEIKKMKKSYMDLVITKRPKNIIKKSQYKF